MLQITRKTNKQNNTLFTKRTYTKNKYQKQSKHYAPKCHMLQTEIKNKYKTCSNIYNQNEKHTFSHFSKT